MTVPERLRTASDRQAVAQSDEISRLGMYGCYIAGEWVETGNAVEVHSPFNDELVTVIHRAEPKEIEAAISKATSAFQVTRKLPVWKRAEVLEKISAGIAARREEFAQTIALEAGKPMRTARDAAPLVEDERIKLLTFTGSPAVGWGLKTRAGCKRVALELGGNAGVIVHNDADVAYAAERVAWGGFSYAGQSCISVQRVYVLRIIC